MKKSLSGVAGILFVAVAMAMVFLATTAEAALKKGEPAPPIKVTTTSGQPVTLANYKGYVLLIDFFASWCHPCEKSIPHLIELNKKYGKQGLQILGLSLDEDSYDLIDFIKPKKLNYPVALADEDLQEKYGLRSIPTMVIVDKKGNVVEQIMGLNDEVIHSLELTVKKLVSE